MLEIILWGYLVAGLLVGTGCWVHSTVLTRFSWFDTIVLTPITMLLWPFAVVALVKQRRRRW